MLAGCRTKNEKETYLREEVEKGLKFIMMTQPRPQNNFKKNRLPLIAKRCAGDEVDDGYVIKWLSLRHSLL